ncbi:MAG: NAD-dependent epimerase/dehydratase family protein [Acidimicrobiia bacterium]|nr:NAD-dependent epimerase/dehydratase family protein [Acidimicrobiia bacterium]
MKALVIGGTGPTGPSLVNGLSAQGWDVTILHTGRHEVDSIPASVEHLHCSPFRVAEVDETLAGRTFDLVFAMYGRLRDLAPYFRGRCGRFMAVGGVPAYRGFAATGPSWPGGMLAPVRESDERATDDENVKVSRIVHTEDLLFEAHPDATLFRYPLIYGPGQPNPREWLVVRRILDGRRRVIVADGGLTLRTAGYGPNVGHALVLAAQHPDVAAGKAYNVGDEHTLTARQAIEVIGAALGAELEIVNLPAALATPARPFLSAEMTLHKFTGVDAIRHDLGYRDVVPAVEALARTARHLATNPVERGSTMEMRLQDPFDYEAEDRLVAHYRAAMAAVAPVADEYDPDFRDRYSPGSDDWRLVEAKS